MSKAIVETGICGLSSTITATDNGDMTYKITLESQCGAYKDTDKELTAVPMMALFDPIGTGIVYDVCRKTCKHSTCTVPSAILKCMEVAAAMALPKDAKIILENN